jgi:N-acetylneuraminic acid mutarotase
MKTKMISFHTLIPILLLFFITCSKESPPELSVNADSFTFTKATVTSILKISNSSDGELSWEITDKPDWIETSKSSGILTTGRDFVDITADTSQALGTYSGTINISSNGGSKDITVTLIISIWTTKASMPAARDAPGSAVNEKIYLFGGGMNNPSIPACNTVMEYDPVKDTWDTTKSPMPTARLGSSAITFNGKIYVLGGIRIRHSNSYSIVEVYDPATDTWDTTKSPMPTARLWFSTSIVNGKFYVIGGEKGIHGGVLSVVEEYDPATDTWTTKSPMPTERFGLSTSAVNGKIYAIGGCSEAASPFPGLSTVEEYDPATNKWTKKTAMPTARFWVSAVTMNNMIFTIGGYKQEGGPAYGVVEVYDPASDTWFTEIKMPTSRFLVSTCVVGGKIYAINGIPCSGCPPVATNEEYTPGFH